MITLRFVEVARGAAVPVGVAPAVPLDAPVGVAEAAGGNVVGPSVLLGALPSGNAASTRP